VEEMMTVIYLYCDFLKGLNQQRLAGVGGVICLSMISSLLKYISEICKILVDLQHFD
jgi:hypothetical protein